MYPEYSTHPWAQCSDTGLSYFAQFFGGIKHKHGIQHLAANKQSTVVDLMIFVVIITGCHFSPILSQHCILSFSLFLLYKIMCSLWFMFSIQLACLLLDATCCAIFCQYYEISKPKKFLHSMKKPSNKLKFSCTVLLRTCRQQFSL